MDVDQLQNGSHCISKQRLACRQCQRRKIKCNRDTPCLQCEQGGITCEQSSRKKRTRPRVGLNRDNDLRSRVASLESLVQKLTGDEPPSSAHVDVLTSTNKYLAGPFWSSLASEVQALKDALEDTGDESDREITDSAMSLSPSSNQHADSENFEFILCAPNNMLVVPDALFEPDSFISLYLCKSYLERVDRTGKIFHAPTLRRFTENGQSYLGHDVDRPCNQALKAAIQFSAISQTTDIEWGRICGEPRAHYQDLLQRKAEMKLIQADSMNTTALPTLQALLLYVATLRRNNVSRRSWAIFALVVRLARAFNLHRESTDETFFMREIRRRLWHNIVLMDVFFALDRGSEPIITLGSFNRPLPTNINDDDFSETDLEPHSRDGEVTDMTFALVGEELSACIHRINFLEEGPTGETWQQRLRLAEEQQKIIEEKYLRHCDPSIDFHRLILKVAGIVLTSITLRAVRPMQHNPSDTLPAIDSPWIFELAINSLRQCRGMGRDPVLAKWKQLPWVQWHPIAVALAGLCSIKKLDATQETEAWQLVDSVMAHSSIRVADSKNGSLWQPIEKLYKKAMVSKLGRAKAPPQEPVLGDLSSLCTANANYPNVAGLGPSLEKIPDVATDTIQMQTYFSSNDIDAFLDTNQWLDWDAVIEDIDTGSIENNLFWA